MVLVGLLPFNFSFEVAFSRILGYSWSEAVGSTILMRLNIKLCVGLLSRDSIGVFRWSNRADHGSLLSLRAFLNKELTIFKVEYPFTLSLVMWGGR